MQLHGLGLVLVTLLHSIFSDLCRATKVKPLVRQGWPCQTESAVAQVHHQFNFLFPFVWFHSCSCPSLDLGKQEDRENGGDLRWTCMDFQNCWDNTCNIILFCSKKVDLNVNLLFSPRWLVKCNSKNHWNLTYFLEWVIGLHSLYPPSGLNTQGNI